MLYQSMSESMSYSAKEITDYLNRMEDLTKIFLSDNKVQENMSLLMSGYEAGETNLDALKSMEIYVGNYYFNYADGILKYISLYTPSAVLKTNLVATDKIPQEIQQQLLLESDSKNGAPCWVDTYMHEYGLFLVRNIRQIELLRLETLGTILLNIDMDALIKESTQFEKQYGETMYILLSNNNVLYHTEDLSLENIESLSLTEIDQYHVASINKNEYFITHGTIEEYGWDYYYLISYNDIGNEIKKISNICLWIIALDFILAMWIATKLIGKLMIHIYRLKTRMQQFAIDNTKAPETTYDYTGRGDELGTLNLQFNEMSETIIQLIQKNYINELLKKEAQIKALENQINPHFLYNTLDSIRWRAQLIGESNISNMVESLSILLRNSLNNKNEKNYTVGKEIEVVSAYITIQKIRYESRLNFENAISHFWHTYIIPKFVIQPLIENAIFYGLEMEVDECYIDLSIHEDQNGLHIYIKNTGSEMEDDLLNKLSLGTIIPHGHGIGLLNIDRRIKMQYGEHYGLKFYNENEYAVAEIILPMKGEI